MSTVSTPNSPSSNGDRAAVDQATGWQAKADATKSQVQNAAETIVTKAETVADDVVAESRRKATHLAETGKAQTKDVIRSIGRAVEASSRSLEDDNMHQTASYVRAAANGIESAADGVDRFDPNNATQRIENFVRTNPMLTFGALALAGFALAGAVKAKRNA